MLRSIGALMVARPVGFLPSRIVGLQFWAAADDLALADGDPVDTWVDKSGNGHDVTAALTLRPTFKTNIQNGLPAIRFDGTDDILSGTFTCNYGTIFIIAQYDAAGNFPDYKGLVVTQGGTVASDLYFVGNDGTTDWYPAGAFGTTIWANGIATMSLSPIATFHIFTGKDTVPDSKTSLQIGADPVLSVRYWKGDVLEVIIYDTALSDADRISVEKYLNDKWAIY